MMRTAIDHQPLCRKKKSLRLCTGGSLGTLSVLKSLCKRHSKQCICMMSRILCLCNIRVESLTSFFSSDDLVLTDISKSMLSASAQSHASIVKLTRRYQVDQL
jgi:hypothetical protein